MAKNIFYFVGISKYELEFEQGASKSTLRECNVRLEVSRNQDQSVFFDGKGDMRKAAYKPLQQAFIQGLVTSIKYAHKKGWANEAEQMKYIIDELGRAFAHPNDAPFESTMDH